MEKAFEAITWRVIAIIIIAFAGLIIAQLVKFIIYSISYRKPMWKMLYQTGGSPSSHTSMIVAFLVSMFLIQLLELGYLDWSFAVAIVFGIIVIHDVKGLGYESSRHAILINKIVDGMDEDKKNDLGLDNEPKLSTDIGNNSTHVKIGAIIGAIVGAIGTLIIEQMSKSSIRELKIFTGNIKSINSMLQERTMVVFILGVIAMVFAQLLKFIIHSIVEKKPMWKMLYSSGGFPSSNVAFILAFTVAMFLIQFKELNYLDWSFGVAIVLGFISIHDALGVRYQTSRQAKVLNKVLMDMTPEKKQELGIKDDNLRELLGHRPGEVLVGALIGITIGIIGFFIMEQILGSTVTINIAPQQQNVNNLVQFITMRAMLIFIIATFGMLAAQFMKLGIYSYIYKKPAWDMLHSTGGFPSSHTSFVVSLITALGMIQFRDMGYLDWSFSVSLTFGILTLHDAMGVRYEATKHAIILNKLVKTLPDEKKEALGLVNQPILKELLGHKKYEVFAGAILGVAVGMLGFVIAITCFCGYVNTPNPENIPVMTTTEIFKNFVFYLK